MRFSGMNFSQLLLPALLSFAQWTPSTFAQSTSSCPSYLSTNTTPTLNLTAISAANGRSVLECWALTTPFTVNAQAGTVGALNLFLGSLDNASYTVIPPRFHGGLHVDPAPQYVAFLSGLAHVTLPNVTYPAPQEEAWIVGGKYGVLIAVDHAGVSKYGHITTYPSDSDTVSLQIPFRDGKIPDHKVLYQGPCGWEEMVGL